MKNSTRKFLLFFSFISFSVYLSAQVTAPDEETGPYTTCNPDGQNATRTSSDLPGPVNVGTIDDRSCYADYKESMVNGKTWGVYNITVGSNHLDAPNTLQPRIERSLTRSTGLGVGSYARFTGTVRILEVGETGDSNNGTYIMQAKGKHIGGGGPPDPAICLYLARPVYGPDSSGNQVQVSFDVYREQINYRGGSGSSGRQIIYLTNIAKNVETDIVLEVGFREDPSDSTKKIHYADAVIGDSTYKFNIPQPGYGTQSGVRYGAYRVKGGRAQIRWANTTYQKVDVAGTTDPLPPAPDIYRIKNVATGKYLRSLDATVVPSDSGVGADKEWQLVKSEFPGFDYYNIASEVRGVMRFKGGAADAELISTNFSAPNQDVDKVWEVIPNSDGSFTFETRDKERYLYHAANDTMIHSDSLNDRSKWILESTTSVSIDEGKLRQNLVKIYPNPAEDAFTISFEEIRAADITIIDMLGKVIYQTSTKEGSIELSKAEGFLPGLYLIQVKDENAQTITKKFIMN